jgi:hypothetical protein
MYYASLLWWWHTVMILVRIDHLYLRVERHNIVRRRPQRASLHRCEVESCCRFCLYGEHRVPAIPCHFPVRITFPVASPYCKNPAPPSPNTGALSPLSSRCLRPLTVDTILEWVPTTISLLGMRPLPPWCSRCFPCNTLSVGELGWPCHCDRATCGDYVGKRTAPVGPAALPRTLGQAKPKAMGQELAQHCAADFEFVFFFQ